MSVFEIMLIIVLGVIALPTILSIIAVICAILFYVVVWAICIIYENVQRRKRHKKMKKNEDFTEDLR